MNAPDDSLLGRATEYPDRYDPGLLFPIPRAPARAELGIDAGGALPFHGVDLWNAYELSWLDRRGKPIVALGEFRVPAASPNLIESKSFKLYLNGFNQERIGSAGELKQRLVQDLSHAAGAEVAVSLVPGARFAASTLAALEGESIDELPVSIDGYGPPAPDHLRLAGPEDVAETLVSDLLKSNCPVTGQPDWASVQISYRGARIDREGLLRYLVSFRQHAGFHEACVERIFIDVQQRCSPQALSVYARYTRRGGLDINPWRATQPGEPANPRGARQ